MTVLYLTFDGVLQPLGYSQVVRVITGLARKSTRYALLSVERNEDLDDGEKMDRVRRALQPVGIAWHFVAADLAGSKRAVATAVRKMFAKAHSLTRDSSIRLLHARGYQAACIAESVRAVRHVPFLFDARGCWIDERSGPGDWFSSPTRYALGKLVEQQLYRRAAAVVTLTQLQANDVIDGAFGVKRPSEVAVVPTCADYADFSIERSRTDSDLPAAVAAKLRGKTVFGIVGSLNRFYDVEATMMFARAVLGAAPNAHLLVLTQQEKAWASAIQEAALPSDRYTITGAPHDAMPRWLKWIDWGLLLLPERASKRGSMPTKLAEFFAAGVRPIAFGCNSEVTDWVRRAGSGRVLDDLSERTLFAVAREITSSRSDPDTLLRARQITEPHFGLAKGIERYDVLLGRLGV